MSASTGTARSGRRSSFLASPLARAILKAVGWAPRDREFHMSGSLEGVSKILFLDSGRLPDLLFFLPAIQEIRDRHPQIRIQILVCDEWAELLRKEPGLDDLIIYSPEQLRIRSSAYLRLLKMIKSRDFDCVVMMGEEPEQARDMIAYVSRAGLRMGAHAPDRAALLNCMVRWTGQGRYRSELAQELMRLLGLRYDPLRWRFRFRPDELRAARQLIHFRKPARDEVLIGVDPDAGISRHRFVEGNLAQVVNRVGEYLDAKAMIFHLPEKGNSESIAAFARMLRPTVLDLPPQGLRDTYALLSCCDLFIGGNTNLFHMAVAAGIPSMGLFTEADGLRWEPGHRRDVCILRGREGEPLPLDKLEQDVERILHANSS